MSEWLRSTYGCLSIEATEKNVMVIINISKSSVCLQKKKCAYMINMHVALKKPMTEPLFPLFLFCTLSLAKLPTKHARTHELSRQMTARARHFLFLSSWRCFCSYYHFLIAGGNKTNQRTLSSALSLTLIFM